MRAAVLETMPSELHIMDALYPHPLPAVLGHESAGVVEAVGEGVTYVQPGDHVITCLFAYCGGCDYCLTGRLSLCSNRAAIERPTGEASRVTCNGEHVHQFMRLSSFAEQMLIHEHAVVKINKDMPLDRAALIGCGVTTGLGAVFGTATVIGMIPIGTKIELHGVELLAEKKIQGSNMGSNRFRVDMPRYIDPYMQGRLKLDELVSARIKLEDINSGFAAMKAGSVARSVIIF